MKETSPSKGTVKVPAIPKQLTRRGLGVIYTAYSRSDPEKYHICVFVSTEGKWICSCRGWQYQDYCWHVEEAQKMLPQQVKVVLEDER